MFPFSAFAGDSVFLETLINTDKNTYVANFSSDTKNKNKKYAFKYINMGFFLSEGCNDKDHGKQMTNPNYCFVLNATDGRYNAVYNTGGTPEGGINIFLSLEGFADKNADASLIDKNNNIDEAWSQKAYHKQIVRMFQAWKKGNPLSYPGYNSGTVTNEQSEYAQETLSVLVSSLNGLLQVVNDGNKYTSTPELVNKSIAIRPDNDNNVVYLKQTHTASGDVDYQGFVIVYADLQGSATKEGSLGEVNRILSKKSDTPINATSSSSSILDALGLPRANPDGWLYAYVFPIKEASSQSSVTIQPQAASLFTYAIPKGFMDIKDSSNNTFYIAQFLDGGKYYDYINKNMDVPWITIHMISMYANTVYKQNNLSINTYADPDAGVIPTILNGMFKGLMWALRGILGLTEIETLVFNLGSRGSSEFNFGLMSENWWNVVLQYQLIFQALAWVILVCGFIKTLIELNLSTVNPQKRMNLFDTIQKFIVVGLGLVILIPCVQFMLECNNVIVDLFASQIDTSVLNMPLVSNWLVQIFVGFAWIMILLYINFLYIMRSVTVAILIASGPFFIATISWGHGKSALFSSWARELVANIFVQSVHAFILSFLCQLLATGGGFLETFAIAISIIPLTEMFRGLIFAGAGGSTSQMANAAASATTKLGTSAVKGVVGGVNAGIGLARGGKEDGGEGGKEGGGGKDGGTSTSNISKQAQSTLGKIASGKSLGAKIKERSAAKRGKGEEGKAGASLGAKIGGTALDALGAAGALAGMAATALPDMMDGIQGMSDLMLKGDASSLGKHMEKAGANAVGRAAETAGAVGAVTSGLKERKAAQAQKAGNFETTQGQAQITGNGSTVGGATVRTTPAKLPEEKEFYASNETIRGDNVADLRGGDDATRSQAMAAFNASSDPDKRVRSALIPDGAGGHTKAQLYSYKDSSGHTRHFAMSEDQVKSATSGASKATGKFDFGAAQKVGKAEDRVMPAIQKTARHAKEGVDDVHMAKVQRDGSRMRDTSDNVTYYDQNGTEGSFRTYKGQDYFMEKGAQFSDDVGAQVKKTLEAGGRVEYEQERAAFATSMATSATRNEETGVMDMKQGSVGEMTNAAMVTALGKQVEGSPGVYSFAGQKWNTGMDQKTATGILQSQGISAVQENKNGSVSFSQRQVLASGYSTQTTKGPDGEKTTTTTAHARPPLLAETSYGGGKAIGRYDLGIATGQPNAPTAFIPDRKTGGGSLTFASQSAAAQYMLSHGYSNMAQQILNTEQGKSNSQGIHTFQHTDNGFAIQFNGELMQKQGMSIGTSRDGTSMYVSSQGNQVANPFAVSAPSPESTASETDEIPQSSTSHVPTQGSSTDAILE